MKTNAGPFQISRAEGGFTLPEAMISSTLLILLTSAIICTFVFGLNLQTAAEAKVGADDESRKAVMNVTDDIRSATGILVGRGGVTNFTPAISNVMQTGAAIQIYPGGDTNTWVRYYCEPDPAATNYGRLCRLTSASGTNYQVLVPHSILNTNALFTAEDSYGNVLTNNSNIRVIGLYLQLYSVEDTLVKSSSGASHDYYQLQTRITRRRLF